MIRSVRLTPLVCLVALLSGAALLSCPPSRAKEPSSTKPAVGSSPTNAEEIPIAVESDGIVGPRSCSSTACHGAVQPPRGGVNHNGNPFAASNAAGILRNEFLVWLEEDPHSGAAATLLTERSQDILHRLHALDEQHQPTPTFQWQTKNCAACHSPQTAPAAIATANIRELAVGHGVTCESCHGAAAGWVDEHYSRRWAQYDAARKSAAGMTDTSNLLRRAEACAKCHVGAPGMAVNHDLIAAGHPPLKFEFTAYLDLLPKHWNDAKERADIADFESRSWLAGQVACVEAALELLAWRSDPQQQVKEHSPVWPEFAEFDCYACHHDLQSQSWRIEPGSHPSAGQLKWGSWYLTMTRLLADDHEFSSSVKDLAAEIGKRGGWAKSDNLQSQLISTCQEFDKWLVTSGLKAMLANNVNPFPQDRRQQLWKAVATALGRQGEAATFDNWEVAVQSYLMLVALDRQTSSRSADALRDIRSMLAFEPVPKGIAQGNYHSPTQSSEKRRVINKMMMDVLRSTLNGYDANTPSK